MKVIKNVRLTSLLPDTLFLLSPKPTLRHGRRYAHPPARWCSGESVRIAVGRSGVHSLSQVIPKDFKKWYSQLPCLALSIYKGIVWRTSRQACLLCPWARHLTGRLRLYVADRWPSRTSPDYNCEVANPACPTTLGYPPVAVRLVGGGATSH